MTMRHIAQVLLLSVCCSVQFAQAEVKEYVRDYNYHGAEFDTRDTSRVNAIDGVKRELLDELGTYVGSVVKTHQDSLGKSYMSHDVINITAGIVAMKVLNEKWKQPEYYVKAGMKADPDDVLVKLKAMRADLELEKSLRDSYEELQRARAELDELKAQLALLKKTSKESARNPEVVKEVTSALPPLASVPAEPAPDKISAVKPSVAQTSADKAQKDLAPAVKEEKSAPSPAPLMAMTTPVVMPAANFVPAPVAAPTRAEEARLVSSYQRAVQNIEVEEAFQRGLAAQISGDFSTLVKEMRVLAEQGNPRAQIKMGWICERGIGVPQDYQKALDWYEDASAKGAKNASAYIGNMYEKGFGVKQDYEKAAVYYRRAIELDDSSGYARMGYLHETGKGVQFDRVKAAEYYAMAIARGNFRAMTFMGLLYQHGHGGLGRDDQKAVELFNKAIDHGDPLAMTRLGEMYNQGRGGLPRDREKAMALFLESARYNLPAAYAHLGRMYEEGWATKQDYAEAKKLYEKAAEHDAIYAMKRLGFMYKKGLGVKQDLERATYWFNRAASLGDDKSEEVLKKRANWR